MQDDKHAFRRTLSFFILSGFFLYTLFSSLNHYISLFEVYVHTLAPQASTHEIPDFGHYIHSRTLTLPNRRKSHRILIVGDIHGQFGSFHDLLAKLDYDPSPSSNDILIHVGDILAKGTVSDSLRVLDWMSTRNTTGVRGNHDQVVIEWKSWRDWIRQSKDGRHWLDRLDRLWEESIQNGTDAQDPAQWLERQKSKTWDEDKNWWKMLPKGWKMNMFGEHYLIASAMKQEHYDYLLSLPLVLHVPSHHAFIAHAGMLPSDPSRSSYSPRQPLAHIPDPPKIETTNRRTTLRNWQEMSLINDVPQNQDPWVLLNVRSLMKDHTVTRNGDEGTPWSQTWNNMMNRCSGYSSFSAIQPEGDTFSEPLPCLPSTVIYGHSAARGLDVKRWSFGLDSGCVYGRRLTALVLEFLTRDHTLTLEDLLDSDDNSIYDGGSDKSGDSNSLSTKRRVRFGDDGEQPADAYLVDVECR